MDVESFAGIVPEGSWGQPEERRTYLLRRERWTSLSDFSFLSTHTRANRQAQALAKTLPLPLLKRLMVIRRCVMNLRSQWMPAVAVGFMLSLCISLSVSSVWACLIYCMPPSVCLSISLSMSVSLRLYLRVSLSLRLGLLCLSPSSPFLNSLFLSLSAHSFFLYNSLNHSLTVSSIHLVIFFTRWVYDPSIGQSFVRSYKRCWYY